MHQIIHAIVDAQTKEDALGVARGSVFDRLVGATRNSRREFDYYVTFDEEDTTVAGKARWGDLPIAARLNSEEGWELLARGWNATKAEFERNLQQVRDGLADLSDEQIMADTNFVAITVRVSVPTPVHRFTSMTSSGTGFGRPRISSSPVAISRTRGSSPPTSTSDPTHRQ